MMEVGSNWNRWRVDSFIGEGSFGKVYKIVREEYGHSYESALKVIRIPQSQSELQSVLHEGMSEEGVAEYFQGMMEDIVSEFALMSELRGNSNIVSFEDHMVEPLNEGFGWDVYIRMELLTPLFEYLKSNTMTVRDVVKLGIDMCKALEVCQRYNIIHRDIKPENIFRSRQGDFKLGDFGIARQLEKTSGMSRKGTYSYMAPEVFKGFAYNSSVDIYSLGIVLYQFLNNNRTPFMPPFPETIRFSDKENANIKRMSGEPLPLPCNAKGPLGNVVLQACAYDPKERYASPTLMRQALESLSGYEEEERIVYPLGDKQIDIGKLSNAFSGIHQAPSTKKPTVEEKTYIFFDNASPPDSVRSKEEKAEHLEDVLSEVVEPEEDEEEKSTEYKTEIIEIGEEEEPMIEDSPREEPEASTESEEKIEAGEVDALEKLEAVTIEAPEKELETESVETTEEDIETESRESTTEEIIAASKTSLKSRKVRRALYIVPLIVAFMAITGYIIYQSMFVEVPNVQAMKEEKAKTALVEAGFQVEEMYAFNDKCKRNTVISQSEKAGTQAHKGKTITLKISKGAKIVVPKVVGESRKKADAELAAVKLELKEKGEEYSETVKKGHIISQSPGAGSICEEASDISVVISRGVPQVKVPKVVGMKKKRAKKALKKANLKAKVSEEYSSSVGKGKVVSQSKKPGKKVDKYSAVKITVSLGEAPQKSSSSGSYYKSSRKSGKTKTKPKKKKKSGKSGGNNWVVVN